MPKEVDFITKLYGFLMWIIPKLKKFLRSPKFLVADRIETVLLEVLDLLIEAAYSNKKSTPHIKNPELFISVFTFYSGLSYDISIFFLVQVADVPDKTNNLTLSAQQTIPPANKLASGLASDPQRQCRVGYGEKYGTNPKN